jgi:branched-chain amino acid transport system ATP-binding protein
VNPAKIEGPKMPLLVFGMSAALAGWDDQALGIAAPEIQAEFGLSIAAVVAISTYVGVITTVVGLPMGYVADRVKRVWLVRLGEVMANIGDVIQAVAPTVGVLYLGRMTAGLSRLPEGRAVTPLIADYYPSRSRARVIAFLSATGKTGALVSTPIVGFILLRYGWRQATFSLALMAMVVSALTFLLREPVRGGVDRLEMGVSPEAAAIAQPPPSFQEAIRGAWAIRTLRLQAMAGFTLSLAGTPVTVVIGLISAQKFGLDPFQRSLISTVTLAASLPTVLIAGALSDRLLARKPSTVVVLLASMVFFNAFSLLVTALAPSLVLMVVFQVLGSMASSALGPASFTVMSLVVPARYRATGMQIFTPFSLAGLLLAPALTQLGQNSSADRVLLLFIPVMCVGGLIYFASAASVARDIRAARAASLAQAESERARQERQNKILVCRDVDVAHGDVQILFGVDLDVREGEIVALVGTNGAGKSTLLRAICGLHPAENGAIFFDGHDITHVPAHENARDGIVFMPGGQGVFPQLTVRDNMQTAAWMNRKDTAGVAEGLERVLQFFPRLRERLDTPAGALSGGEQQMLALGQAFLLSPRLLMIDELSLGLAPAIVEQLLDAISAMRRDGVTVILVEQSLNVALNIADRAVFMEKGEVHFDGPTDQLLARPDLMRAVFMGGAGSGAVTKTRSRQPQSDELAAGVLQCEGIGVSFGGVEALADLSLQVASGEVLGVIGPNGAGKTTLFDVVSGYVQPNTGRVLIDGSDVTSLSPDARARLGLGRAFQSARLFPPLTVRENIAVALERRASRSALLAAVWAPPVRRSERKLWSRVDGFVELLGLTAYADKFVRELSTGTRRAVEVACQMAAEPKVLLLDEPSSGLAQAETEALGPALLRIVKDTGCAMLVIEHDLPLITNISDRLLAMELGRPVAAGLPGAVLKDPRVLHSYLAASADVIQRSGSRVGAVLASVTAPGHDPSQEQDH